MSSHQPSAATAVFHTTELLELILLSLPLPSILTASRVCHNWRAAISSSLPLQRALFFTPTQNRGPMLKLDPPGQPPVNRRDPEDPPREIVPAANELLMKTFRLGRYDDPDPDHDGGYMPMVSMGWLENLRAEWEREGWGRGGGMGGGAGEPSWRRMLVAQPPPRRVEITIYGTSMFQSVKAYVECEDGVTLGMMHDQCQQLIRGRPWSKRSMGWFFEL
ncbi:Peroxiredoxin OsmC-like protein [Neofusicoccum parvum]|uniref:Peroxiredoxin OsmC-like protein n=1 Tax=Neofusicoccum parvum TaxID=310453 RepID=A0ACB5SIY0_9PEZI|nr:Peroxiredoxin OsmC-like protein [Neofusicoccum parvum]